MTKTARSNFANQMAAAAGRGRTLAQTMQAVAAQAAADRAIRAKETREEHLRLQKKNDRKELKGIAEFLQGAGIDGLQKRMLKMVESHGIAYAETKRFPYAVTSNGGGSMSDVSLDHFQARVVHLHADIAAAFISLKRLRDAPLTIKKDHAGLLWKMFAPDTGIVNTAAYVGINLDAHREPYFKITSFADVTSLSQKDSDLMDVLRKKFGFCESLNAAPRSMQAVIARRVMVNGWAPFSDGLFRDRLDGGEYPNAVFAWALGKEFNSFYRDYHDHNKKCYEWEKLQEVRDSPLTIEA